MHFSGPNFFPLNNVAYSQTIFVNVSTCAEFKLIQCKICPIISLLEKRNPFCPLWSVILMQKNWIYNLSPYMYTPAVIPWIPVFRNPSNSIPGIPRGILNRQHFVHTLSQGCAIVNWHDFFYWNPRMCSSKSTGFPPNLIPRMCYSKLEWFPLLDSKDVLF
jgi:hypothetical protein